MILSPLLLLLLQALFIAVGRAGDSVAKSTRIGFLHSAFCILHFFQFSLDKN